MKNSIISRRNFLKGAASAAAFTIVPRHVLGGTGFTPPSEKLNIVCVGVGNMGGYDVQNVATENIIALCDVDERQAAQTYPKYPNVPKYKDFRVMLEKEEKNIDAVTVSTPDHMHATVSMTAIKMGKHVYCQKPLGHDIYEVRQLTEAARKYKVVTQMGIQVHATEDIKILVEMLKTGMIGKVREVHLWAASSPIWPAGIDRPADTPPVPKEVDWDLWLGTAAERPYHPVYMPGAWRGWKDFGTGSLGDMGCHIFDPACWALDLTSPVSVESYNSYFIKDYGKASVTSENYPQTSILRYEFAARDQMPPVTIYWYHGGMKPWRPEELETGRELPASGGLYIGENGKILAPHQAGPRLIPETKMKGFKRPEQILPRGFSHYEDWIRACKGGPKPSADFDYSGPLTEMVLLGNISILTGKKLLWDSPNMKITNVPEANALLKREYRQGWTL